MQIALALSVLALGARAGVALTRSQIEAGPIRAQLFAPDWIWQSLHVNVVAVLTNTSDNAVEAELWLASEDGQWAFPPQPKDKPLRISQSVTIGPGATERVALANLHVPKDKPVGRYLMALGIGVPGKGVKVGFPLEVVRGPTMQRDEWTIITLAGVCLVWVAVMTWVLGRYAKKRAWRTPSEVFE
jgi:hypothetical protein